MMGLQGFTKTLYLPSQPSSHQYIYRGIHYRFTETFQQIDLIVPSKN